MGSSKIGSPLYRCPLAKVIKSRIYVHTAYTDTDYTSTPAACHIIGDVAVCIINRLLPKVVVPESD